MHTYMCVCVIRALRWLSAYRNLPATKPDILSLIPGAYVIRENCLPKVLL